LVLAPLLINRRSDFKDSQETFIWLGGALIVFMAFVPEWGARSLVTSGSGQEMYSPLSLAQLAGYLLITATIYFKKNYLNIGWLTLVIVAALVVALKSGSRGQFFISILSVFLVAPLVWERVTFKNAVKFALTGALIALTSYYAFDMAVTHSSRWKIGQMADDMNVRWNMAQILLSAWINSPLAIIFGLGNSASISGDLIGAYPHIVLLEILGEEGIIGFVLFLAVILLSVRQAMRLNTLTILSKDVRRAYAASFGCFLFTLFLSFKQGSLINSPMIFFFAAISEKYFCLVKLNLYSKEHYFHRNRTPSAKDMNE